MPGGAAAHLVFAVLEQRAPLAAQKKMLGENARRLYDVEPVMAVRERVADYRPAIRAW